MSNNDNYIGQKIALELKKWHSKLSDDVETAAKTTGKEAAKKLKDRSPQKTKEYAKGWAVKKVKGIYIVHNQNKPRLTHLLEYGHYNAKGKKQVQGQPHIRLTEQEVIQEFQQRVEDAIKR